MGIRVQQAGMGSRIREKIIRKDIKLPGEKTNLPSPSTIPEKQVEKVLSDRHNHTKIYPYPSPILLQLKNHPAEKRIVDERISG